MLIISKIIYFLISPLSWLIASLFIAVFARKVQTKKIFLIISLLIALFFSNTFIYEKVLHLWETPAVSKSSIEHHQIGIVLGGMSEYDSNTERLVLQRSGDRIWQALDLYYNHKIDKILITGGSGYVQDRGLDEANQFKALLLSWGIPEKNLIIESKSRNTVENAQFTKELLANSYPEYNSFLLITSAIHMKRAQKIFENNGIKVDAYPADEDCGSERKYFWNEYIIPEINTFNDWFRLLKEIIGYYSYLIMN
ncbi:MAG: YdcF family protein [Chitinophagales bacterium]|nr:YdcF family protein [Chitinophagales bacterium]MCZ2394869.1 YdcF family protein [Chitinophagales bacterium]